MVLLVLNDQVLKVYGVKDNQGELLNNKTVTARILTLSNVEVSGQTWPLTLTFIDDDSVGGNYEGLFKKTIALENGKDYYVESAIDGGTGLGAFFRFRVPARYRTPSS